MKQIKIFSSLYYSRLEEQVNEFLEQNKDKYELVDLSFSPHEIYGGDTYFYVAITYIDKTN